MSFSRGRAPSNRAYDEVSLPDNDISLGRPSTDSISFYQNFGSADMSRVLSASSNYLESIAKLESDFGSFDLNIPHELSSTAQGMPFLSQKILVSHLKKDMSKSQTTRII